MVQFVAQGDNTGAVTLNVNGLGAKEVKDTAGNQLLAGEIKANSTVTLNYNGVWWELVKDTNNKRKVYSATTGGTANNIDLEAIVEYKKYDENDIFIFQATANNTGTTTVNINNLGAKNIINKDGTNLLPNQIRKDDLIKIRYDGTNWVIDRELKDYILNGRYAVGTNNLIIQTDREYYKYQAGDFVTFIPQNDNTGTATVNINNLGVKNLVDNFGKNLTAKTLKANQKVQIYYDGANWVLASSESNKKFVLNGYVINNSSNNILIKTDNSYLDYKKGDILEFTPQNDNTGAVTLNVNGLGVKNLVDENGNKLTANALKKNKAYRIYYNNTNWVLNTNDKCPCLTPKATDPTTMDDGSVLRIGAFYFNITTGKMRIWNGTNWIEDGLDLISRDNTDGANFPTTMDDGSPLKNGANYIDKGSGTQINYNNGCWVADKGCGGCYQGAYAVEPGTRADGTALQQFDAYYNTSENKWYYYDGGFKKCLSSGSDNQIQFFNYNKKVESEFKYPQIFDGSTHSLNRNLSAASVDSNGKEYAKYWVGRNEWLNYGAWLVIRRNMTVHIFSDTDGPDSLIQNQLFKFTMKTEKLSIYTNLYESDTYVERTQLDGFGNMKGKKIDRIENVVASPEKPVVIGIWYSSPQYLDYTHTLIEEL